MDLRDDEYPISSAPVALGLVEWPQTWSPYVQRADEVGLEGWLVVGAQQAPEFLEQLAPLIDEAWHTRDPYALSFLAHVQGQYHQLRRYVTYGLRPGLYMGAQTQAAWRGHRFNRVHMARIYRTRPELYTLRLAPMACGTRSRMPTEFVLDREITCGSCLRRLEESPERYQLAEGNQSKL